MSSRTARAQGDSLRVGPPISQRVAPRVSLQCDSAAFSLRSLPLGSWIQSFSASK